jgi:erythromycin esterase-like protein
MRARTLLAIYKSANSIFIRENARRKMPWEELRNSEELDPLMERIGDARIVLLGESTHGTHEYYTWRARITQRLILEKGFSFIAVEGDWPDCYEINRYVKGYPGAAPDAYALLRGFRRWPTWLWANWEIAALVEWLHSHNLRTAGNVGFYGLDVYSLWDSMERVVSYLKGADPFAVAAAKAAYKCFEPYQERPEEYGYAARFVPENCESDVLRLLQEVRWEKYAGDREEAFNAEQNALVVANAESYYRAMITGGPESWNIRDTHMAETLRRLLEFHGASAKAIVWAHNTHVGDARATDMQSAGMVNVGQLLREEYAGTFIVGFSMYEGEVIAAREWGAPMEKMRIPPPRPGSWGELLGPEQKIILLEKARNDPDLMRARGQRAVGIVYDPEYERPSYVRTVLPMRYDALIHVNRTTPLAPVRAEAKGEPPDLYPWGL